jgi:hypothetical protein
MSKKTAKIEIMNICFSLPEPNDIGVDLPTPLAHTKNIHKT